MGYPHLLYKKKRLSLIKKSKNKQQTTKKKKNRKKTNKPKKPKNINIKLNWYKVNTYAVQNIPELGTCSTYIQSI